MNRVEGYIEAQKKVENGGAEATADKWVERAIEHLRMKIKKGEIEITGGGGTGDKV